MHIHIQAYISEKISDCLIYCILSNGEVIKYHKFISVVVIELSVRCLNTGPEDRLILSLHAPSYAGVGSKDKTFFSESSHIAYQINWIGT